LRHAWLHRKLYWMRYSMQALHSCCLLLPVLPVLLELPQLQTAHQQQWCRVQVVC
jgi:hypothetical protein